MNTTPDLHNRLKDIRIQKGYTQNDIAQKLNISRQAVSRWENGRAYPDIDNLALLSEIYGISVDALLGKENTASFYDAAADTNNTSSKKMTDSPFPFNRESIILMLLLIFSCFFPVVGVFITLFILIWTLKRRKHYKFIILLSVLCFLISMHNFLGELNSKYQFFSETTIETVD